MKNISESAMNNIHNKTLNILETVGLKVAFEGYYPSLEACGATVDRTNKMVFFPSSLVEKTIKGLKKQIKNGKKQIILNGVVSPKSNSGLQIKFGGASIEYLDPMTDNVRVPTENDLIKLIQFGQSLDEVTFVGNPVCYLIDSKGESIPGPLQRIMTAALVAEHTTKYGSNEVWNETDLDLLVELGSIIRGGRDAFNQNPCFVTAKETIAPLYFPEEDGRVLYLLAERGLPCTIIPMPISGVTCPVTIASNIAMTSAEILGVMTCIRCSFPEAIVGGGVISGIMDMRNGSASFASPEAIAQDLGTASIFENLYGQNFGIGTGYIDALIPGSQSAVEIFAKIYAAFTTGRYNYPVGLLLSGKRWSPVQALIGIEIAKYIHRLHDEISVSDEDIPIDLIKSVGVGGNYLGEMHTALNFENNIWKTELFDRSIVDGKNIDFMIEKAKQKWADFLKKEIEPCITDEMGKEIQKWKKSAIRIITGKK